MGLLRAFIEAGYVTLPDNTVKLVPLTVCLKNLDSGDHKCHTALPPISVTIDD